MKYLSFLFCLMVLFSCKQDKKDFSLKDDGNQKVQTNGSKKNQKQRSIEGSTMGTSYSIKYILKGKQKEVQKETIDSILVSINDAVSTYVPSSTISRLNKAGKEGISVKMNHYPDQHFVANYFSAIEVYKDTKGYFDPSVMPLVNYWGFGYEGKNPVTKIDSNKVEEILDYVGFENFSTEVKREGITFLKSDARSTLDFSAIAKGYAVDYLARYLDTQNVNSYMVEIGGEVKVKGTNQKSQSWKLGINTPEENANLTDIQLIVAPKEKGLASSGNYRIFHKLDDVSYGHEINPKTGYPQKTDILSVSAIHDKCMYADAYATAFMIMGKEQILEFINYNHDLEVCLITKENGELKNVFSSGFEDYVVE